MDKKLTELVDKALTRRSFMARSGVAAAAAVVVAGCGGNSSTPAPTPGTTCPPIGAEVALGWLTTTASREAIRAVRAQRHELPLDAGPGRVIEFPARSAVSRVGMPATW